jgi:predicted porin
LFHIKKQQNGNKEERGMKKSALALAVGAAFAGSAMAQSSTVQIYGKVYPQLGYYKSSGATEPGGVTSNLVPQPTAANANNDKGRASVDVSNSYLGFRGEEKLGGSLSTIYQLEQSLEFDTGTGVFATRNSFLGLRGGFGTIKLGNMDTIYKEFGDQFSMFGISSGNFVSHSNTLSSNGVGTNRLARFHERAPNSVQYLSPEFGDFQAGIQYSPDEVKGNPTPVTGTNLDRQWWSYGVKYEADRFYVSVHQEYRKDMFGGSATATAVSNLTGGSPTTGSEHAKDTATRLSGAFKITPNHRITGDIARLEYKESGQAANGRFEKLEKTNWTVGWEARWGGPWRTGLSYVKVNEGSCSLSGGVACSTSGTDGNQINLGGAYDFSKRTFLFAIATKITAGESAQFDNWANGTPARGADNTQFALGVSTSF